MGRPLTRGSDWPAPLPNTLTNVPMGKGYYPNAITTPPHKRGGSLAPGERGTGLFYFVQIEVGAHGLNHTTQGLKGVTQRCVCDELVPDSDVLMCVCVCVAGEPGVCLPAFLLALQMIVQWQQL